MDNIVIEVTNLSKMYKISHVQRTHIKEYQTLAGNLSNVFRKKAKKEEFWALKNVSFNVNDGDIVGIIGQNGAGKTTILKILSKITFPTSGQVKLKGRVASLLEVGTGFHPELSGRENIYLNGAILGMKRSEINDKFDDIVEFSGVEQFLDTPVKRYSSGMYVRLAFSVAAHLEPEILLIDEVLAVGDIGFQKKCINKMSHVAQEGRTILFVSHNMAAVKKLCGQAIMLDGGRIKAYGEVDEIVSEYENEIFTTQDNHASLFPIVNETYGLILKDLNIHVERQNEHAHLYIDFEFESLKRLRNLGIAIFVYTYDGILVSRLGYGITNNVIDEINGKCSCTIGCRNIEQYLASGGYMISLIVNFPNTEHIIKIENTASFQVPNIDRFGSGEYFILHKHGFVPIPLKIMKVLHS